MKIGAARKALGTLHDRPRRERIAKYREIRSKVRPVMRHFFTEKHYIPSRWFEMRLNYSRSVAVMSMVGHVLGIGDRHVSNILIDAALGELIPIDFGIAFEGVSVSRESVDARAYALTTLPSNLSSCHRPPAYCPQTDCRNRAKLCPPQSMFPFGSPKTSSMALDYLASTVYLESAPKRP